MSTVAITAPSLPTTTRRRLGIEPVDLHRRLRAGGGLIIDLRSAQAFDAAHIPGSLNAAGDAALEAVTAMLPDGSAVAVLGSTPFESARAASVLAGVGPDCDVAIVIGGIERWRRQGLPVSRGLALDCRQATQQVQRGGVALIDARPAAVFAAGHVVGSISVPLDEWGGFRRALPRLPLVVGCSSDELAATAASLFRAAGHGCVWRIDGGGIEQMLEAGATLPVR